MLKIYLCVVLTHALGYYRTQARAMKCAYFRGRATAQTLLDHIAADRKIAIALEKLLTPLFYLKDVEQRGFPEKLKPRLVDIVHNASDMSREMRECGDAIYYWPPTFKDGECFHFIMMCPMPYASP